MPTINSHQIPWDGMHRTVDGRAPLSVRANHLLLALVVLAGGSAHAGAVLQVGVKDATGKTVPDEVYYAQNGMMRIDSVDAQGDIVRMNIIRDGVIWEVHTRERTFSRIDAQSLNASMDARMQAMMANLPPDKRAMMQARLAQLAQPHSDSTFTDTGRSDRSAQYSCHVWQEQRHGGSSREYCVVAASSLPDGDDLAASLKTALETADKIIAGVPMLAPRAEHLTRLEKMNGFPVHWRDLSSSGATESEHVLTQAHSQNLPPDTFAVPQGFTEKPLGERSGG
jgi:hypothetical protein